MRRIQDLLNSHYHPMTPVMRRAFLAAMAALVVAVVLLATQSSGGSSGTADWLSSSGSVASSSARPHQTSVTSATGLTEQATVQVVGLVKNPGVYKLPASSRVVDAVFAAGGFLPLADQASINLARKINDGEQLVVGKLGQSAASGVSANGMVNINTANASQLDSLPGIGPTLAARIVDFRTANGGFRSISDLGRVAGIGTSLLAKLTPKVSL